MRDWSTSHIEIEKRVPKLELVGFWDRLTQDLSVINFSKLPVEQYEGHKNALEILKRQGENLEASSVDSLHDMSVKIIDIIGLNGNFAILVSLEDWDDEDYFLDYPYND